MEQMLLIKSSIAKAFDKIGKTNGTSQPQTSDNQFALVYEFFVAKQLESAAKKRKEAAQKALASVGVLSEDKLVIGETVCVYANELLDITAKTNMPVEALDKQVLENELVKALGKDKADKLLAAAKKTNKPATTYDFVVK